MTIQASGTSAWLHFGVGKNRIPTALSTLCAVWFIAALCLLSGCTILRRPPASPLTSIQATPAARLYQGRFAVHYSTATPPLRHAYGHFSWQENRLPNGPEITLQLSTPLGQTLALIVISPAQATLTLSNQPPLSSPDIEHLMERALGFSLPVQALHDALTSLLSASAQQPVNKRLFNQHGWVARYTRTSGHAARISLMRRMPFTNVILIVDH